MTKQPYIVHIALIVVFTIVCSITACRAQVTNRELSNNLGVRLESTFMTATEEQEPPEAEFLGQELDPLENLDQTESLSATQNTPEATSLPIVTSSEAPSLQIVNQVGRGTIIDLAFSSDGSRYFVSSAHGIATYEVDSSNDPAQWFPFSEWIMHRSIAPSIDGHYIRLVIGEYEHSYFDLETATFLDKVEDTEWFAADYQAEWSGEAKAISHSGLLEYSGELSWDETHPNYYFNIENVVSVLDGELLFDLAVETQYLTYMDRTEPEGCDVYFFGICGEPFKPITLSPYAASFSATDRYLAVMYRSPELGNTTEFSRLRVYDSSNGELTHQFGGNELPVLDFAVSPVSDTLAVAFGDGTIQIWDLTESELLNLSHDFTSYYSHLEYSADSKFVILQRINWVEVIRISDGAIVGRYDATAFSASPTQNILALGQPDGSIKLQRIPSGETIQILSGHSDDVYALAFSTDGIWLASSGRDCRVGMWEVASGSFIHPFEETLLDAYQLGLVESRILVKYLEFLPGTSTLIGLGSWETVVNWEIYSGATNYIIQAAPVRYYQGMQTVNPRAWENISYDLEEGLLFIDRTAYDFSSGDLLGEGDLPENLAQGCLPSGPISIDGQFLYTLGHGPRAGRVCTLSASSYDLLSDELSIPVQQPAWLYLAPDGERLLVTTNDGVIYVVEIEDVGQR